MYICNCILYTYLSTSFCFCNHCELFVFMVLRFRALSTQHTSGWGATNLYYYYVFVRATSTESWTCTIESYKHFTGSSRFFTKIVPCNLWHLSVTAIVSYLALSWHGHVWVLLFFVHENFTNPLQEARSVGSKCLLKVHFRQSIHSTGHGIVVLV